MSIQTIRAALEARLKAFADAQIPALAIAWQNVAFKPAPGVAYLRATLLPAGTLNPSLGMQHMRYVGLLQVSVVGVPGSGPAAAESIANGLEDHFPRGLRLTQSGLVISITNTPSIAPAQQEPDRFVIPVSVPYRCERITP